VSLGLKISFLGGLINFCELIDASVSASLLVDEALVVFLQAVVQAWSFWGPENCSSASLFTRHSSTLGDTPSGFQSQVPDTGCDLGLAE